MMICKLDIHCVLCDSSCPDYIEVEPVRHGHWIFGETMGHSWMKCSECCVSQSGQTLTFTYCPNCGARMDGGKDDADKLGQI